MKRLKQLVSSLLICAMMLSIAPTIAFASDDNIVAFTIEGGNTTYCDASTGTIIGYDYRCTVGIVIPEQIQGINVTSIGSQAFYNCSYLRSISIPRSVTYIGYDAFTNCDNLTDVYYNGSKSDWETIQGDGKPASKNITIHYNESPNNMENFQKSETYTGQFADVSNTHWAASSIKLCYEYGLMNGSDKGFLPSNNLTVAEALVMADRVHQIYTDGESTLQNGTPWYQTYVTYAIENGIINAGDFSNYTKKATRGEMAYIFAHALPDSELSAVNAVTTLPDVNASTAYSKEIFTLYNAGILTGSDEFGTYKPTSTITRAEAAAIISRVAVPAQRKTISLKEYTSIKQGLYTIPGTERMLYVTQDGSNIEFYLWWFHDYYHTGTAVLKGNEATLPAMMLQSGAYISGTLRFNGSSVSLTFDRDPVYFDWNWNFTWLRESFRFTDEQMRDIARSLGVPDSLDVEYEQGKAAYWDVAQRWRTYVRITHNGQSVATAGIDTFTLEQLDCIRRYSGEM